MCNWPSPWFEPTNTTPSLFCGGPPNSDPSSDPANPASPRNGNADPIDPSTDPTPDSAPPELKMLPIDPPELKMPASAPKLVRLATDPSVAKVGTSKALPELNNPPIDPVAENNPPAL